MPKKELSLLMCVALVMGNMIGSGVFMVPASLANYGWISVAGWLLTTAGAIVLALLFARLAGMMPKLGGPYAYSHAAYGDFIGFQAAWGYWVSILAGNAAIAVALVGYLSALFPWVGSSPAISTGTALVFVWGLSLVNCVGIREAGMVQLVTTILKLIPLLLVGLVGIFYLEPAYFELSLPKEKTPMSALAAAGAITLWAFLGLESATIPADNVVNPKRTIPRATIYGVLGAAFVYILGSTAVMGLTPPEVLAESNAPYADAANALFGPGWGKLIAAGAVIATLGALNGWILLSGQLPAALARDKMFPQRFDRRSKGDAPYFGIIISSIFVSLLLFLKVSGGLAQAFEFVALLSTLTCLTPYIYCAFAELIIRINGDASDGRPMDGKGIALSIAGFVYVLWAIWGVGEMVVYLGFLLICLGIPFYAWVVYARK